MVYIQVYHQDFQNLSQNLTGCCRNQRYHFVLPIWFLYIRIHKNENEDTPSVTFVSPTSGFGGESPCQSPVVVEFTGCEDSQSDLKVFFGVWKPTLKLCQEIKSLYAQVTFFSVAVISPWFAVSIPKWIFWEFYWGVLEFFRYSFPYQTIPTDRRFQISQILTIGFLSI